MRRREAIGVLCVVAAIWPLAARAQQAATPLIGFLRSASLADAGFLVTAFRQGLKEAGYVEGKNVAVEYRSAENDADRLNALVDDFVRRPAAVIVGNVVAAVAAKSATARVPIVFAMGSDPVESGLVASLNRPGGNVTGVSFFAAALGSKRLELLRQLLPGATTVALLFDPNNADGEAERGEVQSAARALGLKLLPVAVAADRDLEAAFASFRRDHADALFVGAGALLNSRREKIIALAARQALPACYSLREFATAGGLMSYGASITDAYRQAGIYAGRILNGEKPADLPVMRSTKLDLVLNLRTAKSLGLNLPPTLLALADEVIE